MQDEGDEEAEKMTSQNDVNKLTSEGYNMAANLSREYDRSSNGLNIEGTLLPRVNFYRAMHYSAKLGLAIACRLSIRPPVCDVGGS